MTCHACCNGTTVNRSYVGLAVALVLCVAAVPSHAQESEAHTFTVGGVKLEPRAYAQFDLRAFPDWAITPGTGELNRDTLEVRRIRGSIDGAWRSVTFEVSVDPLDDDGVFLKDAWLQRRIGKALRLRAGQFKLPGTRDYSVPARRMDFLERAGYATTIAAGRDVGVSADGRWRSVRLEAGLFMGDGVGRSDRGGLTSAGRVIWRAKRRLEVGASFSAGRTEADDTEGPNGPVSRTAAGYRFARGVYVQGLRTRVSADAEWTQGRWRLSAEALRLTDRRTAQGLDGEDLPAATGTGASLTVHRQLARRRTSSGGWSRVMPHGPFDLSARYDFLGTDDTGGTALSDSVRPRATNIRPRAAHTWTLGGTQVLNRWSRLLGTVSLEQFTDRRSAPRPGTTGPYVTVAARLQVEWP